MLKNMKFGVLTVSDSSYKDQTLDKSGPKLVDLINEHYKLADIQTHIVPDDINKIKTILIQWSDEKFDVIFTTGGTGIAPRDVTPEATKAVIHREIPGISYAMLSKSLAITPMAMLSRATCGTRNKTLIINFPGSVKAVQENFDIVHHIIPHAVSLMNDDLENIKTVHQAEENKNIKKAAESKVKLNSVASRNRASPYAMVEVPDALKIIFESCPEQSESEKVHRCESLGRVLAEDVMALDPLPPYPASIKDGYAVRASEGGGPRKVQHAINAGDECNEELREGHCVRISTGAPVPPGADAVVQVEDTELISASEDNSTEFEINIKTQPNIGQEIRKPGSDIECQKNILKKGILLNAAEIGILAAVGRSTIKVYKRMSIGIISTGNELQNPDDPLQSGKIRDSNKDTLINLLKKYGYSSADFGIVKDDPNKIKQQFENAFDECDMVITTGGVSMGEHDVVKQVLKVDFNAVIHFGRVNMKPGKPTTFATCLYKGKLKVIFSLPGNPVSATVTCLLFVIPTLRYYENRPIVNFPYIYIGLNSRPVQDKERPEYHRVKVIFNKDGVYGESTGNQISSRLNSFTGATGLAYIPSAKENFFHDCVKCYLLENF